MKAEALMLATAVPPARVKLVLAVPPVIFSVPSAPAVKPPTVWAAASPTFKVRVSMLFAVITPVLKAVVLVAVSLPMLMVR